MAIELRRTLAKRISEEKAEASDDGMDVEAYITSIVEVAVNKLVKPAVSEKVKLKVTLCSIFWSSPRMDSPDGVRLCARTHLRTEKRGG